jgi:membrane protein YqaA with SNARE-associated domain
MSPLKRIMKRGHIYHVYYRRSGTYRFIGASALRLIAALILLGVAIYLINTYVFDISSLANYITAHFSTPVVLSSFFASELTLGLLAPEFYIVWAKGFAHPWLWVLLISLISYLGGLGAYFIGTKLHKLPRVHRWMDEKFTVQFKQIRRYGGILIIIAAITPLPYPPICIVSGVVQFPLRTFVFLTLSRFARIFLYAAVIFNVV